jgi:hypothetical protein
VWFTPFPPELTTAELIELFRDCADRAEYPRREGARVVLVTGCELTLFNPGFLPGANSYDRIARLRKPSPWLYASSAQLPKRLNALLAETADSVRGRFGGPLTYAAGTSEPDDWARFDIVSVDAYRDASNARSFGADLRQQFRHGKPVVATEYGCCPSVGAADKGGLGWDIANYDDGVPKLKAG